MNPPVGSSSGGSKQFGERMAVSEVSFSLAAGEVFGFLGPMGYFEFPIDEPARRAKRLNWN